MSPDRTASRSFHQFKCASLVAAVALITASCGGGGGNAPGSGTLALRGHVGDGYQLARGPGLFGRLASWLGVGSLQAQQALDTVDRIVAIPTRNGNVDVGIYALIRQAEIQPDGGFEMDLDTSYDWVLLLANSQAQTIDGKVVAYISIPATSDEGIDNLPASAASNGSAIDLGTLNPAASPRQANSSNGADQLAQKLSLTTAELEEMARFDDSYRHLYNFYLNQDAVTGGYYLALPEARWTAPLHTGLTGNPDQDSSSLGAFSYDGYYASVMTDKTPSIDFDAFCAQQNGDLSVFPPTSMTIGGMSFDPGTGLSGATATMNQWSSNYCGNEFMRMEKQPDGALMIQFPLGENPVPDGLWRMKWNGNTVAAYDFSLANPVDGTGLPTGLAPRFTLHPAATDPDRIASITIEWYQLGDNGWVPVTDESLIDKLVRNAFVEFTDYTPAGSLGDGSYKNFQQYDNEGLISGEVTIADEYAWYLANPPASLPDNAAQVTDLAISYEMAGVSYRFTWSYPSD